MWCNQFRSSLGVISVCWRRFNLQSLADIREILWSLRSFLLPKNEVDRKWVLQSFLGLSCFSGTSSNEPHSVGQCAKWVAWSKEHQETIKFGGLSTSGVGGLVWFTLKLRQRNEKLLFTFYVDCSLYFHPHPDKGKVKSYEKCSL